jgi:hypothetical protein
MPKILARENRYLVALILMTIVLIAIICYYYAFAFSSFQKTTAAALHDDIIQGVSALGSVAIAVIIFRIQSLENRSQSLEQTTLNYIQQTMGLTYPEWTSSLEDDIKNQTLTNKYYANIPSRTEELVREEKQRQQKRLEDSLRLHDKIQGTVRRIRHDVYACAFFLILPLLLSLILLMFYDILDIVWTFFSVSAVVVLSSIGIVLLIKMVLESAIK